MLKRTMALIVGIIQLLALEAAVAAANPATTEEMQMSVSAAENPLRLNVGPGLYYIDGELGWSLNVGITHRVADKIPLYVGLDAGASFVGVSRSSGGLTASADVTSIRLLPTAIYQIGNENNKVRPYVGVSIGPVIESGSVSLSSGGGSTSRSKTEVDLEMALRPGVEVALSETASLGIEPRLGVQSGEFIFTPQVHGVFSF